MKISSSVVKLPNGDRREHRGTFESLRLCYAITYCTMAHQKQSFDEDDLRMQ